MIFQKIINTLKTFSEADWNDIQVWSQSPIYKLRHELEEEKKTSQNNNLGTKGEILMMFDIVFEQKELIATINTQDFENNLFEKIKPFKENYSKSSFDKRLGELNNDYIEKFIGIKLISSGASEIRWQLQTLRYLSENNLLDKYDLLQNKIEKKLGGKENTSLDLYNLFLFQKNLLGHSSLYSKSKIKIDKLSASNTLQNYFFLEMALFSTAILNENIIYNTNLEFIDLKEKISLEVLKKNIFIELIYHTYLVQSIIYNEDFTTKNKEIYEMTSQINRELNNIPLVSLSSKIEIKSIYYLLLNIINAMINNGFFNFSNLYFDMINCLIDKKLILQRNSINIYLLKTIINMSLQFNKLAEAKKIILNLIKNKTLIKFDLPKKESERIKKIKDLSFNQKVLLYIEALFLFSEKNYKESFDLLKNMRYTGQDRFDIDVDKLKIKLLYELEDANILGNTDLYSKKLKSSNKKFNNDKINLPFKQKEKMLTFIAILSSNKTKDLSFFKTVFDRKPLSEIDKEWFSEKFKFTY